jgi:hypothetical protein
MRPVELIKGLTGFGKLIRKLSKHWMDEMRKKKCQKECFTG